MGENSKIAWCDHTLNPWWGCAKVPGDPACHNCYAESLSKRFGFKVWGQGKPRRELSEANWKKPHRWNREAEGAERRPRVFCASMADIFEDRRDLDYPRERLWALIEDTPNLDWLLLTKRPENIGAMMTLDSDGRENVWLGTTAVTQAHYDERVPILLGNHAAVHFVSVEPQMEEIDLSGAWLRPGPGYPDWLICGGESGPRARGFDLDWARSLRDQCEALGVAFFLKQLGSKAGASHHAGGDPSEWPHDLRVQEFPGVH